MGDRQPLAASPGVNAKTPGWKFDEGNCTIELDWRREYANFHERWRTVWTEQPDRHGGCHCLRMSGTADNAEVEEN